MLIFVTVSFDEEINVFSFRHRKRRKTKRDTLRFDGLIE